MPVLNYADALALGGHDVDAAHLDGHRVWPLPEPFLEPQVGIVTTPDAADLTIDGNARWTSRVRRASVPAPPAVTFRMITRHIGGASGWQWLERIDPALAQQIRVDSTVAGLQITQAYWSQAQTLQASPLDVDAYIGVEYIAAGATGRWYGLISDDGVTWVRLGSGVLENRAFIVADPTSILQVGGGGSASTNFMGRLYWAQMEAIDRAQLVIPSYGGNYLTVNAPPAALGDFECVIRTTVSDWDTIPANVLTLARSLGANWQLVRGSWGRIMMFQWWGTGTGTAVGASGDLQWTYPAGLPATPIWLRFRFDVDNGAGGHTLTPEYNPTDTAAEPTTGWLPFGPPTTKVGTIVGGAVTTGYIGGGLNAAGWGGRIARTIVRSGIAGPVVLDVNENDAGTMVTPTTFLASTGQTVTVVQPVTTLPYLDPAVGRITTPDTADMGTTGTIRWTMYGRIDSIIGTGFPTALLKQTSAREHMVYGYAATTNSLSYSSHDPTGTQMPSVYIAQPIPFGGDHTFGVEATQGTKDAIVIVDAARTPRTAAQPWGFPRAPIGVQIGDPSLPGRIYSMQLEEIKRAQLTLPGVTGNYLSVPDAANLALTDAIEIVARCAPSTWGVSPGQGIVARSTGANSMWGLYLDPSGRPGMTIWNGTTTVFRGATATPPLTNGAAYWLKATRAAITGELRFYWAADAAAEPTSWTEIGTAPASPVAGAIADIGTGAVMGGLRTNVWPFAGRITRVIVRNVIGGGQPAQVLDVAENNAGTLITPTTFAAASGQTVTVSETGPVAHLNPAIGTVSTPDAPDLDILGDVRLTAKVRDDSTESTTSRITAMKSNAATSVLSWRFGQTYTNAWNGAIGYPSGTPAPQVIVQAALRTVLGLTPPGTDRYVGTVLTGVDPGAALTLRGQIIQSVDGSAWTNVGGQSTAIAANTMSGRTATPLVIGTSVQGRVYWAQMEAINRVRPTFPGIAGNYLYVNDAPELNTPDFEIVVRLNLATWRPSVNQDFFNKYATANDQRQWRLLISGSGALTMFKTSDGIGTATLAGSPIPDPGPNATLWVKITKTDKAVAFYWAPDQVNEPTTWTGSGTGTLNSALMFVGTSPVFVGQLNSSTTNPITGYVRRAIYRGAVGGPAVLDIDDQSAKAGVATFVARTGQTVTVVQSAGVTVLQPIPDAIIWRFDAADYPGGGALSYTDPRGRVWTLSAANAIVPAVAPIISSQPDRLVWRFDAAEYPGSGLSYTDPRGRVWTLTAAGAIAPVPTPIVQPQADSTVWRFDANEWPAHATTVTDELGRTWTASAPGAVQHPASVPDREVIDVG